MPITLKLLALDWVYALETDVSGVKDGTYTVSVITERVKPINFVLN